ncbi:MAG: single-stranded-DNA-specific exonuclease RecJ [Bacillota bacterium]|nr:single-stranded-DNA-specific exonuclease RecJ [Bacillota bacterium]
MIFQRNRWIRKRETGAEIDVFEDLLRERSQHTGMDFLSPVLKDLYDPFLLPGMKEAVDRIGESIRRGDVIWIYGDYDVDGITSIAILIKYFEHIGVSCNYYIPDRLDEGYGISKIGLDYIKEQGGQLVITVDCGINAFAEARYAEELGLDLVITDHHELESELPRAVALINPKIEGYPFPSLAGCGVAIKLVQALAGERFEAFAPQVLDLAAVGTIADIVPLVSENRVLAYLGMRSIQNQGLISLINMSGKDLNKISSGDIGFSIAPMINSSGRIGNPKLAVELLIEQDETITDRMAKKLYELNTERQEQGALILEEAIRYVEENVYLDRERVIVVAGKDWHTGIIGITASRLVERYSRPVIILTETEGELKGSARSIRGVSIYEIIATTKPLLLRFGGHDQASGLTLLRENFEAFREAIRKAANERIAVDDLTPVIRIDYAIDMKQINRSFVEKLGRLAPFGPGNPEPLFLLEDVVLDELRIVGATKNHVKIRVSSRHGSFDGIAFNQVDSFRGIRIGDVVRLVFSFELHSFRGIESINLKIKDIQSRSSAMPDRLEKQASIALNEFLTVRSGYEFTPLPDFDIIQSLNRLDVYQYEDLVRLKEHFFDTGFEDYSIHFGELRPGRASLNIVYLPLEEVTGSGKDAAEQDFRCTGSYFAPHVPERADVVRLYKQLLNQQTASLSHLTRRFKCSSTKIVLGLEMLRRTEVLSYHVINDLVRLEWNSISKKKTLEEDALFRHLHRNTCLTLEK